MGELPKEWEITTFGECCKSIRYGVGMPPEYSDDGVPFIRATNIKKGTINEKGLKRVSIENSQTIVKCRIHEGNLIVVRSGVNTGDCAYVPKKFDGALAGFDLIVEFDNHESAKFFNFFINSRYGTSQIDRLKRRAAQEHLNSEQLSSLKVPNPPIALMRQIVAVLEQVEAVKRQRKEADAITGALLQNVFYEMFGDPVLNERGWDIDTIDNNVTRLTNGYVGPTRDIYVEDGIPYLMAKHVKNKRIIFDNTTLVTDEFNQKHAKSILEKGDVLLVQTGDIGQSAVVQDNHIGHNCHALIVITPKKDTLDGQYLSYIFSSTAGQAFIGSIETGITLRHLNCKDVKQMKIPMPPLALQQQFARVVESVERIREQQVASGRQIEGLCEGLMQRAFSGELGTLNT